MPREARLDVALLALAVALVAATRLWGIERWPIYFFTDEAVQAVRAGELIAHGWRDEFGAWLPAYFTNGPYRNLSASVYLQTLPQLVAGSTYSVAVTRGTSALVAVTGAIAVALTLRDALGARFWWAGALVLAITPAWFLHSRTAFETVLATTAYAWFLYFYLRYRLGDPRNLAWAVLAGALAFYAYSPAQVVVVATTLGLAVSDARYHVRIARERPALALAVAAMAAALLAPYLRDRLDHPGQAWAHLRTLDSYWTLASLSLGEKLGRFATEYVGRGLDPRYWYAPDGGDDLVRHRMRGYGHLAWATLPFALIGLVVLARRWRSPAHRAVAVALVAAPLGGALVAINVTRALAFVVPAALVTTLGLAAALELVARRVDYVRVAVAAFAVLATAQVAMLADALAHGPRWYPDYGLRGLQYGGAAVFGRAREMLDRGAAAHVHVTPVWANGTNVLKEYFLPRESRVDLLNIDAFRVVRRTLDRSTLFVMTADEYARTARDPVFADVVVDDVIRYPDGTPGFYLVRVAYSPQADAILADEDRRRREPVTQAIALLGTRATITHSKPDIGRLVDALDGDPHTLMRGAVDNPLVVDIVLEEPRAIVGLDVTTSTMDVDIVAQRYTDPAGAPLEVRGTFRGAGPDPTHRLDFGPGLAPASRVRMTIRDLDRPGDAHVHLRELVLRQGAP
jgi:hypothetical protein